MEGNDIKVEGYTVNTVECDPVVYAIGGDWKKSIYWFAAATLTATVTY